MRPASVRKAGRDFVRKIQRAFRTDEVGGCPLAFRALRCMRPSPHTGNVHGVIASEEGLCERVFMQSPMPCVGQVGHGCPAWLESYGSVNATSASPSLVPSLPFPPAAITTNCLPSGRSR